MNNSEYALAPSRFISAIEKVAILHAFDRVIRHKTYKCRHNKLYFDSSLTETRGFADVTIEFSVKGLTNSIYL